MLIQSKAEILPGELTPIVESVFGTMMGLEVSECATPWVPAHERLTSAVHLSGDWNGAVLVECNPREACRFAGRFLSVETPLHVDEVVRDVLGEMANMIGGNLKCILTAGIQLSTPTVSDGPVLPSSPPATSGAGASGHADVLHFPGGRQERERIAFQCSDGTFWITIVRSGEVRAGDSLPGDGAPTLVPRQ